MKTKVLVLVLALLLCAVFSAGGLFAAPDKFIFPYAFTAEDLYGKTVTEKSLGEKEVFFVHYWATWCPPCIREIPDLASLEKKYGGRVGFIGLLDDYDKTASRASAKRLVEKAGVTFIMADANHKDFSVLLKMVQSGYVPTTILIGKDGKMIGEQIIGAYGSEYSGFLDRALGVK